MDILISIILWASFLFSPVLWVFRKAKVQLAMAFLTKAQKQLLRELNQYHKTFRQVYGELLEEDCEYVGAKFRHDMLGSAVLQRQVEQERATKAKINTLIHRCEEVGISGFRIRMIIKPQ